MGSRRWDGRKLGIVAIVGGLAFLVATRTLADPDLWGHVRFGQLILGAGEIPRSDPFSYLTAGQPWINHEWLAEVVFALSYGLGGAAGLVVLKAILTLGIVLVAYWHLAHKGLGVLRAGIAVALLVGLMKIGVLTVRPHIFTYLFFFAVLLVVEAAERGNRRWLWTLPPIFAIWVNLHGGFLAGLGVLGIWTAATVGIGLWERRRQPEETTPTGRSIVTPIGVLLASIVATLVNPYGTDLLVFLARTATVPRPEISEWQPLPIASVPGLWYVLCLSLLVTGLVLSDRVKHLGSVMILAVTALVPLLAIRHLPLFGLAWVVLGGEHLAGAFARRGARDPARDAPPWLHRMVATVGTVVGVVLVTLSLSRFGCIELPDDYYPVDAVRALEESGAQGNLAVFFNWGEYAIWHLAPDFFVSMDGRRETVYPDSVYAEYLRFIQGTGDWDDLLEKRPTDVALVERGGPAFNLLSLKPGWARVYSDSRAAVFSREGWPHGDALRRWTATPGSDSGRACCFPRPGSSSAPCSVPC